VDTPIIHVSHDHAPQNIMAPGPRKYEHAAIFICILRGRNLFLENEAYKKPVYQCSDGSEDNTAERAVDGIFHLKNFDGCAVTKAEMYPWFAVDLEALYVVHKVAITGIVHSEEEKCKSKRQFNQDTFWCNTEPGNFGQAA
jgi:hypothetical protein